MRRGIGITADLDGSRHKPATWVEAGGRREMRQIQRAVAGNHFIGIDVDANMHQF